MIEAFPITFQSRNGGLSSNGGPTIAAGDAAARPCIMARLGYERHFELMGSLGNSRRA